MSEFSKQDKEIFKLKNENYQLKRKLDFAKRLDDLENFGELVEANETEMSLFLMEIKTALLNAKSFDEFKAMLKDNYFAIESEVKK